MEPQWSLKGLRRPNKAVKCDTSREEWEGLGSVQREEVPLEDWPLSNSATFNNWLVMLTIGFETEILTPSNK